jgi:hypothetical protein
VAGQASPPCQEILPPFLHDRREQRGPLQRGSELLLHTFRRAPGRRGIGTQLGHELGDAAPLVVRKRSQVQDAKEDELDELVAGRCGGRARTREVFPVD